MSPRDRGQRFVGALEDALAADVDPAAGGHLAVHGQPAILQVPEGFPGRPRRHQQRVGNQHPRRMLVRAEDADGLAGLHDQGLVVVELLQRRDDGVEGRPAPGGAARAAVHDQIVRDPRPHRDRDCSSASAGRPPAASPCTTVSCRVVLEQYVRRSAWPGTWRGDRAMRR